MKRRRGEGTAIGSSGPNTARTAAVSLRRRQNNKTSKRDKGVGNRNSGVTATICRCLLASSLHQLSGYHGCFADHIPNIPTRDGIDRLPQRRIRTPTRAVRYPANHPLSRHLLEAGALRRDDSEDGGRIGEDETEMDEDTFSEESNDDNGGGGGNLPTVSPTLPPPTPEPIRIVPILTATTQSHLTKSQQHYLLHTVLYPAIEAWADVIRLIRVEGNLTLDRSQLYDGISCGPGLDENGTPSALPPEHHFHDFGAVASKNTTISHGDAGVGVGVPNADLVVYVELGFREQQRSTRIDPNNSNIDEEEAPSPSSIIPGSSKDRSFAETYSKTNQHPGAGNIRGSDALYKEAGFHPFQQQHVSESLEPSETSAERNSNATFRPANRMVNATHPSLGNLIPSGTSTASLLESKPSDSGIVKHPRCSPAYLASATHW